MLALFLLAQACDGVFTYAVVRAEGLGAEGNLLLATWMALIGPGAALVGAKTMAAACGVLLYQLGVHRVLACLTALYGAAAVGPWLVVLHLY
ncbi:MAG: DUF5658 family protein [Acidobacteriota bacterium]